MGFRDISAQDQTERQRAFNRSQRAADLITRGFGQVGKQKQTERQMAFQQEQADTQQAFRQAQFKEQKRATGAQEAFRERQLGVSERRKSALDARAERKEKREDAKFALEIKKQAKKIRKGPQPKSTQFDAGKFGVRVEQAEQVFNELEKGGFDRASYQTSLQATALPGALKSQDLKSQEQAERNFVNAVLREESGAAIAPSEFESAEKQYFPRAGDSAKVLAQKKRNRQVALAGFRAEAGEAFDLIKDRLPQGEVVETPIDNEIGGLGQAVAATPPDQHPQVNQALQWAKQNQNDPRAMEIFNRLGVTGAR